MTTTNTRNVEESVAQVRLKNFIVLFYLNFILSFLIVERTKWIDLLQILRIAEKGGDIVRLTVQGKFEADACMKIRETLWEQGCNIPLVADIHFAPAVALRVADAFEKIRVNPGNFADGIKSFENKIYNTRVRCISMYFLV